MNKSPRPMNDTQSAKLIKTQLDSAIATNVMMYHRVHKALENLERCYAHLHGGRAPPAISRNS